MLWLAVHDFEFVDFDEGMAVFVVEARAFTLTFRRPRLLGRAARLKGESSHEVVVLTSYLL